MFTDHQCTVCSHELLGHSGYALTRETGLVQLNLTTEPVATATCSKDHRSVLMLLDGAYALLFERGLQRLVTGNTRDAVLDAYSAFEMYLAHVPARARYDREKDASPKSLREEMKTVSKLAERSLGAAFSVVSVLDGRPPPTLNPAVTAELRNAAIHAGLYPTEKQAERLCVEVHRIISEIDGRFEALGCVNETTYWMAAIQEDIEAALDRLELRGQPSVATHFGTVLASNRAPNRSTGTLALTLEEYRLDVAEDCAAWRVW